MSSNPTKAQERKSMGTIEYSLFRAKFIKPAQISFLHDNLLTNEIFLEAIKARPTAELRKGYTWHIGNVRYFSSQTGCFAIGRTTNATIEKFDEESGNFIEEELETSPYTHCVFDAKIGLLGIAKKTSLASTPKGIATKLEQLFAKTHHVFKNDISVEIRPIPDPDGFLRAIISAYRVSTFTATFRGPNPFDADEYFQKPLAVYLSAANGVSGKAQIKGEDLNREVLAEVTRSTAATANKASARIMKAKGQKSITVNLKGDPIKKRYDEEEYSAETVLDDLTNIYNRVRHNDRN